MKDHAAILLRDRQMVLFVQRAATKKKLPNIWAVPSGTIEEGESPEQTVLREALEELGIAVRIEWPLATVELPELGARLHFIVCTASSDAPISCDASEIQAYEWNTFEGFLDEHPDEEIGHGLVYLRRHPELWRGMFAVAH